MSLFFFSSRRRHTRCALVTGVQTCALPIFGDELDPNAWQRDLMDRLAASPGIDHSRDAEIVAIFTRQIYELEAQLPLAIDRDEPLWEIDEALNPEDRKSVV